MTRYTERKRASTAYDGPGQPPHPLRALRFSADDYAPPPPAPHVTAPVQRARNPLRWPAGVVVAIDTREQLPYAFPAGVAVERKTLAAGDYSVVGLESVVAVERKSLSDAWSSIGTGTGTAFRERRDQFRREWERLAAMKYPAVVLECNREDLLRPPSRSQVAPSVVLGTYYRWSVWYRVPCWFAGSREGGQAVTARLLLAAVAKERADEVEVEGGEVKCGEGEAEAGSTK